MAKRDDTKGWKPTRMDGGSAKGRDISAAVDKAAKSRTATSLSGKKC